ncbi:MAG: AAA family ATPase [Gaiellaceae bacterium]
MSDRLWAAMQLVEHPDVCDALVRGLPVPRDRLRPQVLATIGEATSGGDFVLTEELVLLVEVSLNGASQLPTAEVDRHTDAPRATEDPTGDGRHVLATPASEIKREVIEWLEPGRVPVGAVTVLGGFGGLGKSQWTCLLAARLSRGDFGGPAATLIATAEDSPSTTVRPRLEAVHADLELVQFVTVQAGNDFESGLAIPDDIAELERLVVDVGARLLIIDPFVAHLPAHIDSHKDQSVRRALAPLSRLADDQKVAIVAVMHLNKAQGLSPLMRLSGSGAFGNAARSVLLLDRDPDDPDGECGMRRVLANTKNNVATEATSQLYRVAPIVLPATADEPEIETSRLEFLGESEHSGRSLLAGVSEDERSDVEDAKEFLRAELADGARHRVDELLREARKLGFKDYTVQRARKKLGAQTEKADFGRGWEWWLDPEKCEGDTSADGARSEDACHLRETPLSVRDSAGFDPPENAEGDSLRRLSSSEAASHPAPADPYPDGEEALLRDRIEAFDATIVDERKATG